MKEKRKDTEVFITYRRKDSGAYTGRIFDRLNVAFPDLIFMDTNDIQVSEDFHTKIEQKIVASSIVVVVIGKKWISSFHEYSNTSDDFVAIELKSALEQHKKIVPVLLDGAAMPDEDTLPIELRSLARKNAIEIGHTRFERDIKELIRTLSFLLDIKPAENAPDWPIGTKKYWLSAVVATLLMSVVTIINPILNTVSIIFFVPILTIAIALRWPIKQHIATSYVLVMYAIHVLVPMFFVASSSLYKIVSIAWEQFAMIGFVITINVGLVNWICARYKKNNLSA